MTLPRVAWPHAPGRERDVRLPKFAKVSPIGAPCHAAIAVSRMRNEDSKIRRRRVMVGSTHPAPHDARHATCGASHARIDPRAFHRCVIHRHAHRVVCECHARAMCRCACRSRIERVRARVHRAKFRSRCGIRASVFLRARALASVSMHALVPMPSRAARARAPRIAVRMRVAVNRYEHWVCGKRVSAPNNVSTRASEARPCAFARSSHMHARPRSR